MNAEFWGVPVELSPASNFFEKDLWSWDMKLCLPRVLLVPINSFSTVLYLWAARSGSCKVDRGRREDTILCLASQQNKLTTSSPPGEFKGVRQTKSHIPLCVYYATWLSLCLLSFLVYPWDLLEHFIFLFVFIWGFGVTVSWSILSVLRGPYVMWGIELGHSHARQVPSYPLC